METHDRRKQDEENGPHHQVKLPTKAWAGVLFAEDGGTLVAPSSWMKMCKDKLHCWYPPSTYRPRDITQAVDEREIPSKKKGWTLLVASLECQSSSIRGCDKKLTSLAKGKMPVETEAEKTVKSRKHNNQDSQRPVSPMNPQPSSSTNGMSQAMTTPTVHRKKKTSNLWEEGPHSKMRKTSILSASETVKRKKSFHTIDISDEESRDGTTEGILDVSIADSFENFTNDDIEGRQSSLDFQEGQHAIDEPHMNVEQENMQASGKKKTGCNPCFAKLCNCMKEEKDINRRFQKRISRILSALQLYMYKRTPNMVAKAPQIPGVMFPMTTIEQVAALCSVLNGTSKKEMKTSAMVVRHFSWFNDKTDLRKTVHSVSDALMADSLVQQFNFDGKGSKNKIGLKKEFPQVLSLFINIMRFETSFGKSDLEKRLRLYFSRVQERIKRKKNMRNAKGSDAEGSDDEEDEDDENEGEDVRSPTPLN